ncbi:beta-ketoacyl-[acyl-carrier-protein] synthase family protein [Saccharopolyspora gregorii]|uniref:Beta-ketoacyl-[acyl-carrier-protein] synthase family protein n=1 Tax=Saccharopolyspora gregorii TaxID=33914 RepID=A0ABP6RLF0_9PSEU
MPDGGDPADGPSRFARAMRSAAREAIADAGERGWEPGRRVGLLHAVVLGEVDLWREFYQSRGGQVSVREYLALMPSTPMSTFMKEFGFHGPAMNVSAMCASGNAGMLTAKAWLDAGIVDDVIFVATDLSASPENVLHFERLGVVVTDADPLDACRPFQEGSRGFVMGEASVGMVLSRGLPDAYARVLGGAMSHDAHHVTSIEPNLAEVTRCVRDALDNAGVAGGDIRYLNAHGPGTAQCDRAEARFCAETAGRGHRDLLGEAARRALPGGGVGGRGGGHRAGPPARPRPAAPRQAAGDPRLLDGPTPFDGGLTLKSSIGMGGHNSAVVLAPPR